MAGGPLPLRIAGREVPADVPGGKRAVDRVGDGVHRHVGIRVPEKPVFMRNFNAAKGNEAAGAEGVDVKSVAEANVHILPFPFKPKLYAVASLLTMGPLIRSGD